MCNPNKGDIIGKFLKIIPNIQRFNPCPNPINHYITPNAKSNFYILSTNQTFGGIKLALRATKKYRNYC